MEQANMTSYEMNRSMSDRAYVRTETVINMVGVLLFYVVLFVAVNVFSS